MAALVTFASLTCAAAGCSLEVNALTPQADDAGRESDGGANLRDAGGVRDASTRIDASVPVPDGGATQDAPSSPEDGGVIDAGMDAGEPRVRRSCDDLFRTLNGYQLCEETESECEFYADPTRGEMSCDELCATAGQTCRGTWSEGFGGEPICTRHDDRGGCGDPGDAFLCRCTRAAAP